MYELNSLNLDLVNAEVAYRHRVTPTAAYRDLPRPHRWPRLHRSSGRRAN